MAYETISGSDARYALISFDKQGQERNDDPAAQGGLFSNTVLKDAKQDPPSHIFFFSHGWKGDLDAAKDQYNRWIGAMLKQSADRTAAGPAFKPLWIGLHWPSLPFGDEEFGTGDSFDIDANAGLSPKAMLNVYLERLGLDEDARPQLQTIITANQKNAAARELPPEVATAYRELADKTGRSSAERSNTPEGDAEPFHPQAAFKAGNEASSGANFGGGGLGGLLGPLRQLSFWTMKKRARTIGESGMHDFVEALMQGLPQARLHLMGHSFGTIVMSSIVGGRDANQALPRPVDSLALVQGAVSLWAFADKMPRETGTGYFNPFLLRKAVRGPILVTRSTFDKAVGTLYPLASQVSFASASFAVPFDDDLDDNSLPTYGAIGAFGIRGRQDVTFALMLPETGAYGFQPGKIYNLESSQFIRKGDGISGAHCDIDGPQVAHALWQAASV